MSKMNNRQEVAVYRGMSVDEVQRAYNVMESIPDVMGWLAKNRERSKAAEERLQPVKDLPYGSEEIQKLDIYAPEGVDYTTVHSVAADSARGLYAPQSSRTSHDSRDMDVWNMTDIEEGLCQ